MSSYEKTKKSPNLGATTLCLSYNALSCTPTNTHQPSDFHFNDSLSAGHFTSINEFIISTGYPLMHAWHDRLFCSLFFFFPSFFFRIPLMCLVFIVYSVHTLYSEPGHNISYKITCPPSNDSDQPAQMRSLIRVIALRFLSSQTSNLPLERTTEVLRRMCRCAGRSESLLRAQAAF